jgi:hypothetical protein
MDPQQWRKAELCILSHQDRDEPNSEGRGLNMKKGRRKRRKYARKINNKRKIGSRDDTWKMKNWVN